MKEYIELLKDFQQFDPEMINSMKECSHHFNSKNLSPFHLCDDLWTHTMLMYKDIMINYNDMFDDFSEYVPDNLAEHQMESFQRLHYLLAVIVLCHDIGKIYNRSVPNGQYGKIAMYNHSFSSVQPTIDFLNYLMDMKDIYFTEREIYGILNVISNHMDYFGLGVEDRVLLANKNPDIFYLGEMLHLFDMRNSIDINGDFLNESIFDIDKISHGFDLCRGVEDDNYDVVIYCGCPGSGKDYCAEQDSNVVWSFDQVRVDKYLTDHPYESHMPTHQIYKSAFEYCNEIKFDLNTRLIRGVKEDIENHDIIKRVAICNTSLSRKSRRSLTNQLKNYNIKIVYVVAPSYTLHYRNENRSSKKLDKLIMNKFMYNQQVPSLFEFKNVENVKKIEVVYNV